MRARRDETGLRRARVRCHALLSAHRHTARFPGALQLGRHGRGLQHSRTARRIEGARDSGPRPSRACALSVAVEANGGLGRTSGPRPGEDVTSAGSVVLTGAASGIGAATARRLVASGRRVVLVDRDAAALPTLQSELGSAAPTLTLDVTDSAAVDALPQTIPSTFHPVTALINNAGHDPGGTTRFDLGSADDWQSAIETNLLGTMRVTRALLPGMVERNAGDIVNIGSIAGIRLMPTMAAYTTSKVGVHGFSDSLRADLAETAIRVTEIMPALTKTD